MLQGTSTRVAQCGSARKMCPRFSLERVAWAIRRRKFRLVTVETSSHDENCLTSGHSVICFKKSVCLSEHQCFLPAKRTASGDPCQAFVLAADRTLNLFFC